MGETVLLGIPVPSTSPLFLAGVGAHVLFGVAAVIAGAMAMFSRKGSGRHRRFGVAYFWSLAGVFATATGLAVARWPADNALLALAVMAFASACAGRLARRGAWRGWVKPHIAFMGLSYVVLLTAFYVDNGASLPLWRLLPPLAYWLGPSVVGAPIIAIALLRHPLARAAGR